MPETIVVDGLNCAVVTRENYLRIRNGAVDALNLTIVPTESDLAKTLSHLARQIAKLEDMSDLAEIATSVAQIEDAKRRGKIGVILGAQDSSFFDQDPGTVGVLQRIGFRILQPTYMKQNGFGCGVLVKSDTGLTDAGRQWVEAMNRHRVLIDLSHVGYRTAADAIAHSTRPTIFSHSNARALCNSVRNIPDELIRAVAAKGGTVGATLYPPMLRHERRPTLDDYAAQVRYLVDIAGAQHVAFGSDLSEGRYQAAEHWHKTFGPRGLYPELTGVLGDWFRFEVRFTEGFESMQDTPQIWDALRRNGLSTDVIEGIMGRNLLRVYREVWGG